MKNNISFDLQITTSKIMSFLILILGTTVSIYLKSELIMSTSLGIIAAIITNKQYQDRKSVTK